MKLLLFVAVLGLPLVLAGLSLVRKRGRRFFAVLLGSDVLALGVFLYVQTVLNTPDQEMEIPQFYFPLMLYLVVFGFGIYRGVKAR